MEQNTNDFSPKQISTSEFCFRIRKSWLSDIMTGDGGLISTPGSGVTPRPGGAPSPVKGPRNVSSLHCRYKFETCTYLSNPCLWQRKLFASSSFSTFSSAFFNLSLLKQTIYFWKTIETKQRAILWFRWPIVKNWKYSLLNTFNLRIRSLHPKLYVQFCYF